MNFAFGSDSISRAASHSPKEMRSESWGPAEVHLGLLFRLLDLLVWLCSSLLCSQLAKELLPSTDDDRARRYIYLEREGIVGLVVLEMEMNGCTS